MVGEHTESDLVREKIPLNVSFAAMKSVLDYCKIFDFFPINQRPDYIPYKIKLQLDPLAIDFRDLMTTKEIIYFQEKSLEEVIELANVANYLDAAIVMDAMCASIALFMRQKTRDFRDKSGKTLIVSKEEDQ